MVNMKEKILKWIEKKGDKMGNKPDRAEIIRKVKGFKQRIKGRFYVTSMILFGSVPKGTAGKHSDVDILVVSKKYGAKHFLEITPKLYNEWHLGYKGGYPVDFLLYNTREFGKLKKTASIVSEALKEGITI
ncbi:nucleotidyltransferase domain-containing protein [Candidatus Woesearchaeota archaeon]|nr:nucleotidyltransferase domain-containing protein [Candidatus Woesearchaeota archaeon]